MLTNLMSRIFVDIYTYWGNGYVDDYADDTDDDNFYREHKVCI